MTRISIALSLLLASCTENDLDPGSFLDRDRVLGARVEVTGDPSRASPQPGEEVSARWILAGPGDTPIVDWRLAACVGDAIGCHAEPFVDETGSDAAPELAVIAPDADVLWIVGEIGGTKVTASVPIGTDNHNPSLAGATVESTSDSLSVTIPPDVRERDDAPLQISTFTTAGELERQFTVLDGGATTAQIGWTPPQDGTTAHFVIVLRDGRGGLDAITREL